MSQGLDGNWVPIQWRLDQAAIEAVWVTWSS